MSKVPPAIVSPTTCGTGLPSRWLEMPRESSVLLVASTTIRTAARPRRRSLPTGPRARVAARSPPAVHRLVHRVHHDTPAGLARTAGRLGADRSRDRVERIAALARERREDRPDRHDPAADPQPDDERLHGHANGHRTVVALRQRQQGQAPRRHGGCCAPTGVPIVWLPNENWLSAGAHGPVPSMSIKALVAILFGVLDDLRSFEGQGVPGEGGLLPRRQRELRLAHRALTRGERHRDHRARRGARSSRRWPGRPARASPGVAWRAPIAATPSRPRIRPGRRPPSA